MPASDHLESFLNPAGYISKSDREWLRDGLMQYLKNGTSLHTCLGINRHRHLLAVRDAHLVSAWHETNSRNSNSCRSLKLLDEIKKFKQAWPFMEKEKPDPKWSRLRNELFFAFQAYPTMPTTGRQIGNILQKVRNT